MPATAGRVRRPANNRIHSSSALQTHGIWQSTIGDPYKPKSDLSDSKPDAENSYANYQGLLQLARLTKPYADEVRGECTRCGRVGHLTYQCRNYLRVNDKEKEEDQPEASQAADVASKLKGKPGIAKVKDVGKTDISEEEDEDSDESSDSHYDSDMERVIAQRHGKISVQREKLKRRKKKKNKDYSNVEGSEPSDTDSGGRKKRGRSKKRRSRKMKHDDSDDSGDEKKKRREEKRRKRDESSDEDGKRRRRHRKSRK